MNRMQRNRLSQHTNKGAIERNFEKIQVNENFPASHFAVPAIPRP